MTRSRSRLCVVALLVGLATFLPCVPARADGDSKAEVARLNEQGIKLSAKGSYADAVEAFEMAARLAPDDQVVRRNLAVALGNLGTTQLEKGDAVLGEKTLRRSLEMTPDEPVLRLNLAAALEEQGYPDKAAEEVRHAVRLDAAHPAARRRLGDVLYREGDLEKAVEMWRQARSLGVDDARLEQSLSRGAATLELLKRFSKSYSAHFEIRFDMERHAVLASLVLRELEEAHAKVSADLRQYGPKQLQVLLLTPTQFQETTGSHDWVGGLFDGRIRLPAEAEEPDEKTVLAKARHEYVHAVLGPLGRRAPSWLHEGLAQVFERREAGPARERVAAAGAPEFEDIQRPFSGTADADAARLQYDAALAFTAWLREGRRAGSFRAALAALFRGERLDAAFRDAYRHELPDLYLAFVGSLRR